MNKERMKLYLVLLLSCTVCIQTTKAACVYDTDSDADVKAFPDQKSVFETGDPIEFSCAKFNRKLIGNKFLFCEEDGKWNNEFPTCEKQDDLTYCRLYGDPHITTFDRITYEFKGGCTYLFAGSVDGDFNAQSFKVEVENHFPKAGDVAWLRKVIFEVGGTSVELSRGRRASVNGRTVTLPYFSNDGMFQMRIEGKELIAESSFGLELKYDGEYFVAVGLPSFYRKRVKGLCGNFDGDPGNDFGGKDQMAFGKSQNTDSSCTTGEIDHIDDCRLNRHQKPFENQCSIITNMEGPFRDCIPYVSAKIFYRDCLYDLCKANGTSESFAKSVEAMAGSCQRNGAQIYEWRSVIGAVMECVPNSAYDICGPACPDSCDNADQNEHSCLGFCREGCFCNDGFIKSLDGDCVPANQCGCLHDEKKRKNGESFFTDSCIRCTCMGGNVNCSNEQTHCTVGGECIKYEEDVICDQNSFLNTEDALLFDSNMRFSDFAPREERTERRLKELRRGCVTLPAIAHSVLEHPKSYHRIGESVNFKCKKGFVLRHKSNNSATCEGENKWKVPSNACEDVDECQTKLRHKCGKNQICVNNGGGFECQCKTGYELEGNRCLAVACDPPRSPQGGYYTLTGARLTITSFVYFHCHKHGRLVGSTFAFCTAQRTWSHPTPVCKFFK